MIMIMLVQVMIGHVNLHTDDDGNDRSNIASRSGPVNLCDSRNKTMTPFMLSRPPSMNVT